MNLGTRSHTGFSPSMTSCSKELRPDQCSKRPLQITIRTRRPDFKFELLPLHSPLLRQSLLVSFPPLIDMLKFSGYSCLIRSQNLRLLRLAPVKHHRTMSFTLSCSWFNMDRKTTTLEPGKLDSQDSKTSPLHQNNGLIIEHHSRTDMPHGPPRGAICVQRFDDSLNSAIHITYRVLLRSSSMREPRDPLLKVLYKFTFLFRHLTEYHIDFIIKLKVD